MPAAKKAATKSAQKQPTKTPRVRQTLVDAQVSTTIPADPKTDKELTKVAHDDAVLVSVPRGFTLTLDDGTPVPVKPGVQNMPRVMADHWFSKNMGVERYVPPTTGKD